MDQEEVYVVPSREVDDLAWRIGVVGFDQIIDPLP
jgi:hypothetical protein